MRVLRLIPAHAGSTTSSRISAAYSRAHPRSRGEHIFRSAIELNHAGSSPLTRGAPEDDDASRSAVGLIPAHAGSTASRGSTTQGNWAHPRSRGEHASGNPQQGVGAGSSPLTRGARRRPARGRLVPGLIPAHAGSTGYVQLPDAQPWAHPRSRGEHSLASSAAIAACGSSPLTRGAPCLAFQLFARGRLIPAHAGSTVYLAGATAPGGAHPRSRGEHLLQLHRDGFRDGSSPLTRGAPSKSALTRLTSGLIPAHAGSTACRACPAGRRAAHPRSRGEHAWSFAARAVKRGSSPLTRGALRPHAQKQLIRRLIPAHAGSTVTKPSATPRPRAHPRSRGEHFSKAAADYGGIGSSPLTRGARAGVVSRAGAQGLIPAHAGSTSISRKRARMLGAHPRSRGEHSG